MAKKRRWRLIEEDIKDCSLVSMCTLMCACMCVHIHTVYGLIYDVVRHDKFYSKRKDSEERGQPALPGQKPDLENMKEESVE